MHQISIRMQKVHNFSAGPSILPRDVLEEASEAILNFKNTGLSILEMSHRSEIIENVINEGVTLVKDLLTLPDNYKPIFLTGGASSQFYMVPMNLLAQNGTAAYINTGRWAENAFAEAKIFGNPIEIASSKNEGFTRIPRNIKIDKEYTYLHITSNNTVAGTQYHKIPETDFPIVADMSSDIFSREIDIKKYGLIYAGAQKNIGPAGATLVIVNEDILGKTGRDIPTILDYRTHIKKNSAFNTPPVYAIYISMLYLRWIKQQGGIQVMKQRSIDKSTLLYKEIDRNSLFEGKVAVNDRSLMNATFLAKSEEIEKAFLQFCDGNNIVGIQGHRSVGGFRVSMYNAMPDSSVKYLVEIMQEFEKRWR